jgi:hypothetical protein
MRLNLFGNLLVAKSLKQDRLNNKLNFLILFIPLFYLFTSLYFRLILGNLSLRSTDPDYVYFMTGLNISEGILKVIHIDHPGTPLQYLVALIFKLTYWLRGHSTPYYEDVLSHPDLYLSIVNVSANLILAIALFASGMFVFRKTGSVIYAMLIQNIPLISVIWYELIGRVTPELIIPLPMFALTILFIGYVSSNNENFSKKELVMLSLIMAFGLSVKLTLIPIWVIPLIVVRGWRQKVAVIIMSVLFFLIIAFPVTLQLEKFWNWSKDLFIHSGQYGSGEVNFVDIPKLKENVLQIIQLQKYFTIVTCVMAVVVIYSFFILRKTKKPGLRKKVTITFAILLSIGLQVIMAGKHYESRYFLPALMFGPLLIYLLAEISGEFFSSRYVKFGLMTSIVIFIIWNFKQQVGTINYTSEAFENQINARQQTKNIIESFEKESIKIIVSQDYGCPMIEYALHFSTVWSDHDLKPRYLEYLARKYPNTYQYTTWDGKFIFWGEAFDPQKIIDYKIPVYVYLEKYSEELYVNTIEKLSEYGKGFLIKKKLLFENPVNGEAILKLIYLESTNNPETSDIISTGT